MSTGNAGIVRGRLRTAWGDDARPDAVTVILVSICALLALLAVIGPWITPYAPQEVDVLSAGQGASAAHPFGTDAVGRDIFSRVLAGARLSLAAAAIIIVVSTAIGTAVAIACAWTGGWLDSILARLLSVMFAFPSILVAIIASAVFGAGFWAPVLGLSVVYVPYIARVVRSVAVAERRRPYVEACELAGLSGLRICTRHILRNVWPIVIAQATIGFGAALMDFGAISFLGLGMQPPTAEWGVMVGEGRSELLNGQAQQSLAAGLTIVVAVVSFNLLGNRLSQKMDERS